MTQVTGIFEEFLLDTLGIFEFGADGFLGESWLMWLNMVANVMI